MASLNKFGVTYGINIKPEKCQFGDTVNFLDVIISNRTKEITTNLFSKPTDANRYLNRASFHPAHTFRGLPFSQFRRAALICSSMDLREEAIDKMVENFGHCGYNADHLQAAKDRAMLLDRELLLGVRDTKSGGRSITFPMIYTPSNKLVINYMSSIKDDIETLIGHSNIIFSQKRNNNVASLLFNKYGFAQSKNPEFTNQKCGAKNCKCCPLMYDEHKELEVVPGFKVKSSKISNCTSVNQIYVSICTICDDFYFGQTINRMNIRCSGHRNKFNEENYTKSALAYHLYKDHYDHWSLGLSAYKFIIVEAVGSPHSLDRRESFYIWKTKADTHHLNRMKVQI